MSTRIAILAVVAAVGTAVAQPASFIDLGIISTEGTYTFDTLGSLNSTGSGTDTELAIWAADGTLLDFNDDVVTGTFWSEVTIALTAGEYYLGTGEFDAIFGDDFANTGSGFEAGESATIFVNINSVFAGSASQGDFNQTQYWRVEVVPAPASAGLLGLGGLIASRRRRA